MTTTPQAALLSDADDLSIYEVARASYRRHKSGGRGQMMSAADDFEWHLMRATEQAVLAKLQAAQEPAQAGELPEPELGYIKTDKSNQPAYSARQMRAALAARKPLTDEQRGKAYREVRDRLKLQIDYQSFSLGCDCTERAHGIGLEVKHG